MRLLLCCASLAALLCGASAHLSAQSPKLELTIQDGRVTLIAQDVPLKDVLQAWARVGDTRIVNGDKMLSTRVTLQIRDTPEAAALDILLRSAAGYIAAPRPADHPGPSRYDRITILVSSTPPAASAAPVAMTYQRPAQPQAEPVDLTPQPSPAYSVPADANDPQTDAPIPMPGSFEGAQPTPSQARPSGSPFAGMHTQLEGAQPKASDWAELMKNQGRGGGVATPQTATRPGVISGGRGGGAHL